MVKEFSREILEVISGIDAIEACRKNTDIDLVLMDIQMSEMSGIEATKIIREFNKDIIIIAQTAYALAGDREKTIEAGFNDYITKPISKTTLVALINNFFKK